MRVDTPGRYAEPQEESPVADWEDSMNKCAGTAKLLLLLTAFCLLPIAAEAQSALTGVVKDTSGAVLPGVTVEAASPALIEKTRSTVTDESGGFKIVDLRPGIYSLTFTLEGFSTVKREGLELPSNFTMTVNIDLKVGALEETLTVTGSSPIVDVQSTTKAQVLSRETLDAIPTGRTIQAMGQLVTGISLSSPDVGGSRAMQQTYMSAHGAGASQTTVQVDGLMVNGIDVDGQVQNYFNSSMSQEMVYTTSGAAADVSGGGVKLNMIPRDGGNKINGSWFGGYQTLGFQSDNLTQDLQNRGLSSADGISRLWNTEGSLGGPIRQDKVWFFMSARMFHLGTMPADTFNASGPAAPNAAPPVDKTSRGVDPQSINSAQARVIWQISQKNKLAVYNDRLGKNRGRAMTAGYDPATAGIVWTSPIYSTGSIKFTSTATSRIFIEGGFSTNYERYHTLYEPGISKTPYSPEWYTTVNKQDSGRGTQWNAGATNQGMYPDRFALAGSASYVTGIHNIKVGVQDTWGRYRQFRSSNGDLRALFLNGVATQATILNTPVRFEDDLKADIGIYGQDQWTLNRLTLNYGARWEYFAHGIPVETSTAGRFSAPRTFGPIDMPTWKSISPRLGVVYDVFGNQRTAIKGSIGKYMQQGTTGFSNSYNPLALTTQNVSWTDLNNDGVPQGELGCTYLSPGCELNLAQLPVGFGVANIATFDPNMKRMWNLEDSLSIQHEIVTGVSLTAGWYRRDFHNLRRRTNTLQTFADYAPFTLFSPIDGTPITYYNVSTAKRSAVLTVDEDASNDRKMWYNAFEFSFSARLPHSITIFGGGTSERMLAQVCDEKSNPNLLLYCDQTKSGIPYRTQFKIAGSVPLRYGLNFSFSLQSLPGYLFGTAAQYALAGISGPSGTTSNNPPNGASSVWLITPTSRYTACPGNSAAQGCVVGNLIDPGMTVSSLSVPLVAPMTEYGDRINQLDINIAKTIMWGHSSFQPKIDFFNVLNRAPVITVRGLNYGTPAYLQPSSVLVGRVFQIGAVIKF
jgi:carboxypeptidase family protein